ncbi:MFS transporter [Micromonospora eburnea]|uniref:MFS transporter n=1 Tax=Micromonospora eburnea TaxID=227316 RepID=UPI000B88C69C|nr:MFS transporter [Micromonospora eburnea]
MACDDGSQRTAARRPAPGVATPGIPDVLGALRSNTGTWLCSLTAPYVLYQTTGSAVWVGWAAVAQFAPELIFAPLGGTLADTHPAAVVGTGRTRRDRPFHAAARAFGPQEPLVLVGLLTLFGILNGINNPAWQSLVNDFVPPAEIFSAVTLNSLQFNLARAFQCPPAHCWPPWMPRGPSFSTRSRSCS